jgi:hypothetical protein
MSRLTLELPETLHQQLVTLAKGEGVSLIQYIPYSLTKQTILSYTVKSVPENEIIRQRTAFNSLLQSLGRASFAEIEKIIQEREVIEPEVGLSPEVVKRLQDKIAAKLEQLAEQ